MGSAPLPPDYFQVLGVDRTAGIVEIQRAFVLACFLEHPDRRGGTSKAGSRFLIAANAYATLIDTSLRTKYERDLLSWAEHTPTWTAYHGEDEPHPSWPTDFDMDDTGLLAAYSNILVDAYSLHMADSSRRLPMLVAVPTCLVSLLSTARDVLIPILNELPGKELLAAIVDMAEKESEFSARSEIKRHEDEKTERRRRSRFRSDSGSSVGLGHPAPQHPQHPPVAFPRRSNTPPEVTRRNSGVRDLVAILEERNRSSDEERKKEEEVVRRRRLSKESTLSTSCKMKKKVTFDDSVTHGRAVSGHTGVACEGSSVLNDATPPQTLPQQKHDAHPRRSLRIERSASIEFRLERAALGSKVLSEPTDPLYDSPQDEAYLSDISSSTSEAYESADNIETAEGPIERKSSLKQKAVRQKAALDLPDLVVTSAPGEDRHTSWLKQSRPGAKTPPKLSLLTNVDPVDKSDASSKTVSDSDPLPRPTEDDPPPPPSPSASTATTATRRQLMMNAIADKLPERVKKPFTPKTPSSTQSSSKQSSRETLRPTLRRARPSYPPISDEDFNAITRRPVSPSESQRMATKVDLDYLSIVNSQLRPSRFLNDPHRVMDEIMAMQGPPRPLHPPSRRAPTVRSSQSSAIMHMSSGDESNRPRSSRSASMLSFTTSASARAEISKKVGPQASDNLRRIPSSSSVGSFYANSSPVTDTLSLPTDPLSRDSIKLRNRSSQSLDRYRVQSSRASTRSLPLDRPTPRQDSFFKRKRDQSSSDLDQRPPDTVITFKRNNPRKMPVAPRVTSPVFENTESSGSESDSDNEEVYNRFSFSLPKLVHTSSLTDSPDELATPTFASVNKALPSIPRSLEPHLRKSKASGPVAKTPRHEAPHRPVSSILSSSTPDLHNRNSHFTVSPTQFGVLRRPSSSITVIDSLPSALAQPPPIKPSHPRRGHTRQQSSPACLPTYARNSLKKPSSILAPTRPSLRHANSTKTFIHSRGSISPPMPLGAGPSVLITPPTPRRRESSSSWMGSLRKNNHRKFASDTLGLPVAYVPVVDKRPGRMSRLASLFTRKSKLAPADESDYPKAQTAEWVNEKLYQTL